MLMNCKEPRALASLCTLGLILQRDCWDKFAIGICYLNLIVYFIYLWASFLKSEWFLLGICREDGPWNWMELSHLSQRGWPSLGRPRKQCNSVRQEYRESLWHPGWCKCFWAGWWWETCQLEKGPHWICWKK